MKYKYIWFTFDGIGAPIAEKLQAEGNEVIVAQLQDVKELGFPDTEKPENKAKRLRLYDGILKKIPADIVLKALPKIKNKDEYFIVFDFNNLWNYGEQALKMGFKNIFAPTKEQFEMERERNVGKKFVEKHYPELKVAEVHEFKTIDEAVDFLEESEELWVLKSNSDKGETFVPSVDKPEFAKEMIIDKLNEQKKEYESEGFILERKIPGIREFTPEMMFWNGELILTAVDIEYKHIGAGANGQQVGCGNNLIIKVEQEEEAIKMAFPAIIYEMAKKHKGLFVWDASILYSPDEDEYYFGEFCANRVGWDSIFAELEMAGGASMFFERIANGENPLSSKFGVSVRGFNADSTEDSLMLFGNETRVWVYDRYLKKGKSRTTGLSKDLVVFTGASNDPEEAVDEAYEALDDYAFNKMQFRPKFDFLTREFDSSLVNRYETFNHKLWEAPDFECDDADVKEKELNKIKEDANKSINKIKEDKKKTSIENDLKLEGLRGEIKKILNENK